MKQRSPAAVFFLPIITLGIYSIVWQVKTKNEMNQLGANIPTAWLLIIPIVNWWWLWKYCEGVDKVTNGASSAGLSFALLFILGSIGMAIIQSSFNKVAVTGAAAPQSPVGPPVGPTPPTPPAPPVAPAPQPPTTPPVI